ncbi:hypothetical protein AVEN_38959-1 [Araneus ventricosus]|uniref:Uncharacterized protein n=1 Tax=Araneus ventricosus TaxID=182803 RepID=A0A4Y2NZ00_ARAVE|nr:hypothetical protein AVEN_38959-1 [Araneus ventricosus]
MFPLQRAFSPPAKSLPQPGASLSVDFDLLPTAYHIGECFHYTTTHSTRNDAEPNRDNKWFPASNTLTPSSPVDDDEAFAEWNEIFAAINRKSVLSLAASGGV